MTVAAASPGPDPDLNRVQRIDPRTVWGNEARDFTPWLADNLDLLASAIGGLDLQLETREGRIGDFQADLVGTDLATDRPFVVENQLADTDHKHLGQTVTYAAGLDARVVVWVSARVRDEHRRAVDWLNEISREDYAFFAVRVELLRIGNQIAPDFVVVAGPNAWQKRVRAEQEASATGGRGEIYRGIWADVIEAMMKIDATAPPARPQPLNWLRVRGGDTFISFSLNGPRVEIYLPDESAKDLYDLLYQQRVEIEEKVGPLSWERLDEKQACRIAKYTSGDYTVKGTERKELIDWLVSEALRFRREFQPFVDDAKRRYEAGERASRAS